MKKITLILSLILSVVSISFAQNKKGDKHVFGKKVENLSPSGHVRCASTEYEEILRVQNPKMETREQFENWISKKIKSPIAMSQTGGIIYIPVVVHVIHNGDTYGTNENITDEQVQSQITVMNQDFRKMSGTPGFNSDPVGADVNIEFVLAKVDPNGNPTNGINRVNLCRADWNVGGDSNATITLVNLSVKPITIWDASQYMNMWSVNFGSLGLLGYAQFPSSSGLTGLNPIGGADNTDGVVANFGTFGSRLIVPTGNYSGTLYDEGRTMTHEVGHFLGLRHLWGDGDCTVDDFCADTPNCDGQYYAGEGTGGCIAPVQCGGPRQIQNYMDYSDDSCMNIFTNDQKTRITTVLTNSPRRNFAASNKDIAIPLFANDAEVIIENSCGITTASCTTPNPTSPAKRVLLYNRGTSNLTSATLSYRINAGTLYTNNWSGNLAPGKYASILLSNTATNGFLSVSITGVNGGSDQRSTNDVSNKLFGTNMGYANTTSFTFNLIGDSFGSETSWTLKNQAGTTFYAGGTATTGGVYPDIATGTQVLVNNAIWTLPANGCYVLTMNDSYGDGVYDGVSRGSYTITAGASTIVNVTDFIAPSPAAASPISRLTYFTNDVNKILSNDSFSILEDVVLYPNPSKDFFTIDVPEGVEKNGNVEIYNNIGQKVMVKAISSDSDLNINASSFANGVYFVNLTLGDANKTLRFIKE